MVRSGRLMPSFHAAFVLFMHNPITADCTVAMTQVSIVTQYFKGNILTNFAWSIRARFHYHNPYISKSMGLVFGVPEVWTTLHSRDNSQLTWSSLWPSFGCHERVGRGDEDRRGGYTILYPCIDLSLKNLRHIELRQSLSTDPTNGADTGSPFCP